MCSKHSDNKTRFIYGDMTEDSSPASHLYVAMTTNVAQTTGGNTMTSSSQRGIEFYFRCAVIVVALVATAANGLVLYALFASKQHKKLIVIVHQIIVELFTSSATLLIYFLKFFYIYFTGSVGYWLCALLYGEGLLWLGNSASIFSLTIITIERYLKIVYPVWSKNKLKIWMIYSAMAFAWIISVIAFVGERFPHSIVINGVCLAFVTLNNYPAMVTIIIYKYLAYYVIPIFIFVFCYWRILLVVRRQARVMAGHSAAASSAAQAPSNQIQTNVIKTMILVCALFTISWTPINVCGAIAYIYQVESEVMYYVTTFIAFSYLCTNPFVYATKFNPVKEVLLRMIPCKKTSEGNAGTGTGQAATNRTKRTK